jgi:hypothetical protein
MMGQRETMTAAAAGSALRRTVVLMTVVALMVVMLAMSVAAPAFAGGRQGSHAIDTACKHSGGKAFSGGPGAGSC